jgi:hypothetical protein
MPLQALPTELDVMIIDNLNQQDLSYMSQTSKYYRRISEPLLYRGIRFGTGQHHRIKQLLVTLVSREDLRKCTEYYDLVHADDHEQIMPYNYPSLMLSRDPDRDELYDKLWAHVSDIQKILDNLAHRYSISTQFKTAWLTLIFEPCPGFDGALSLLLCLAHNLKAMNLDMSSQHTLPMTRLMLQEVDWHNSQVIGPNRPFQQLKTMAFGCPRNPAITYDIPVMPQLETLAIRGNTKLISLAMYPRNVDTSHLRTLQLFDVNLDPQLLIRAIQQPRLRQLTVLGIVGVGRSEHVAFYNPWEVFDYQAVRLAMEENLLHLEAFAWIDMRCYNFLAYKSFGSFSGFPHLAELQLDLTMFLSGRPGVVLFLSGIPGVISPSIHELGNLLPPSLKAFHLRNVRWHHIELIHKCYQEMEDLQPDYLTSLVQIIASFAVPLICVEVDMRDWLATWIRASITDPLPMIRINEPAIDALRRMADALYPRGVVLRVEYFSNAWNDKRRLLVERGFTAWYVCYDNCPEASYRMGRRDVVVVSEADADWDPTRYVEEDND